MKIAWAADIHLDHAEPAAVDRFVEQVQTVAPSALLLAGDIGGSRTTLGYVDELERRCGVPVRYVLGNHDFYRSSIPKVREQHRADRRYLHTAPTSWPLGPNVDLVGVDGWGDSGWAPEAFGQIRLSDFHMIREFSRAPDRRIVAEGLGRESAEQLRRQLMQTTAKTVVVVTHVPPIPEACLYEGQPSGPSGIAAFACRATWDVLQEHRERYRQRLIVLSGHTHGPCQVERDGIEIRVAGSDYGTPRVEILDIG